MRSCLVGDDAESVVGVGLVIVVALLVDVDVAVVMVATSSLRGGEVFTVACVLLAIVDSIIGDVDELIVAAIIGDV